MIIAFIDLLLNLDTILIQLRDISSKWLELGTAFELSHDLLHSIRTKCDGKDFDCLIEVCEAWLRSFHASQSHPTWKAVSKALDRIGCNQLSKELSEIYITGISDIITNGLLSITHNCTATSETCFSTVPVSYAVYEYVYMTTKDTCF